MLNRATTALYLLVVLILLTPPALSQSAAPGDAYVHPGGTVFRLLLDENNVGTKDVEVGEMVFQPGTESASHAHGSLEIFYVIEGVLEHIVNGNSYILEPGMVGFVHAGDEVIHKVPEGRPAKTLVIWVPGGESDRIRANWRHEPR